MRIAQPDRDFQLRGCLTVAKNVAGLWQPLSATERPGQTMLTGGPHSLLNGYPPCGTPQDGAGDLPADDELGNAARLTIAERMIEKTSIQVDFARIILAVAALVFAFKAPATVAGLGQLIRLLVTP